MELDKFIPFLPEHDDIFFWGGTVFMYLHFPISDKVNHDNFVVLQEYLINISRYTIIVDKFAHRSVHTPSGYFGQG